LSPCIREWSNAVSARPNRWSLHIGVDHTIDEEFLDRPHRREVCPDLVPEVLEGIRLFSWEDDVLGKEAVPERVETDDGFALWRLWSRGVESVGPVSGFLSFARHGPRLPLILETCPSTRSSKNMVIKSSFSFTQTPTTKGL
jgi:hypothetical protein